MSKEIENKSVTNYHNTVKTYDNLFSQNMDNRSNPSFLDRNSDDIDIDNALVAEFLDINSNNLNASRTNIYANN